MARAEIICPRCGGAIDFVDCMDTDASYNIVIHEMVGACVGCSAKIAWKDVYNYYDSIDIEIIEG